METPKMVPSFALGLALVTCACISAVSLYVNEAAAAAGPFEPNDSLPSATGPLTAGPLSASMDQTGDRDFFFFYIASERPARLGFVLANHGGGGLMSDVDLTVMDGDATPLGSISFVRPGEERGVSLSLPPGKYFAEVSAREEYGDSYSLTGSGEEGTFARYNAIAGKCQTAKRSAKASGAKLSRARIRLQRAVNRVRRSRYEGRRARLMARGLYRKARTAVHEEERRQRDAERAQRIWCVIPA
jgi:hypothetical protein